MTSFMDNPFKLRLRIFGVDRQHTYNTIRFRAIRDFIAETIGNIS